MSRIKLERINSAMVREISYILANEIKDRDLSFVTITDVLVTADLSFAKVYFTVFENDINETLKAFKNATGFIKKQLAMRMEIRHIPDLEFVYDESIAYGDKIEKIIEKIKKEK